MDSQNKGGMMKVIFPIEKETNSNKIVYPDDKQFFSNTEIEGDNIIAEYTGTKGLTEYIEPPKVKTILSKYEFRKRFTLDEKVALKESTDAKIQVFQDDVNAAEEIDLNNADLISGMQYAVSLGLLTDDRAGEILCP